MTSFPGLFPVRFPRQLNTISILVRSPGRHISDSCDKELEISCWFNPSLIPVPVLSLPYLMGTYRSMFLLRLQHTLLRLQPTLSTFVNELFHQICKLGNVWLCGNHPVVDKVNSNSSVCYLDCSVVNKLRDLIRVPCFSGFTAYYHCYSYISTNQITAIPTSPPIISPQSYHGRDWPIRDKQSRPLNQSQSRRPSCCTDTSGEDVCWSIWYCLQTKLHVQYYYQNINPHTCNDYSIRSRHLTKHFLQIHSSNLGWFGRF